MGKSYDWLPFEEARAIVRSLYIGGQTEYNRIKREGKLPEGIPACPHLAYKKHGWVSWNDWFGKPERKYGKKKSAAIDFNKAWEYAKTTGCTSPAQWARHCANNEKVPDFVPSCPQKVFGDQFPGWEAWLGVDKIVHAKKGGRKRKIPKEVAADLASALRAAEEEIVRLKKILDRHGIIY